MSWSKCKNGNDFCILAFMQMYSKDLLSRLITKPLNFTGYDDGSDLRRNHDTCLPPFLLLSLDFPRIDNHV